MRLPGHFGDKTYGETGVGVSAAESVDNKQTLAGKLMGDEPFQVLPGFRESGLLSFFPLPLSAHHSVSRVVSSRTIYLSFGERPVKIPVSTAIAPSSSTHRARILPVLD
jgi:hypothetical protein